MQSINFQAIYRKGVLKPKIKLNLPEDSLVEVQVTPVQAQSAAAVTLFGAFPKLAGLSESDMAWARKLWEDATRKQSRFLDE